MYTILKITQKSLISKDIKISVETKNQYLHNQLLILNLEYKLQYIYQVYDDKLKRNNIFFVLS